MKRQTLIATLITVALAISVGMSLAIAPDKTSAQLLIESGSSVSASESGRVGGAQSGDTGQSGQSGQETAVASSASNSSSGPAQPAPPVTGSNVSVIGDSVTLASLNSLQDLMPGIDVSAEVSRSYFVGISMTQEWAQSGRLRPYVVIALATNGPLSMEAAEEMVQNCGPERRVVFVTGFGPASITWIAQSNQTIRDIAAKYPNQVAVADWASAIEPHQDLLAGDDIHPGRQGGDIFAATVQAALKSFGGEVPSPTPTP